MLPNLKGISADSVTRCYYIAIQWIRRVWTVGGSQVIVLDTHVLSLVGG